MNDLNQNKETVDAPVDEAMNEQPVPAKKGAYMWRAILIPTLGLHWLLTAVFIAVGFLVFGLFEFLHNQFGVNTPGEFFVVIICSVLMIWLDIRLGRDLAFKTEVPVGWARRWLPLLVYPLFTLIVAALCMVLSDGFWKRDCWGVYFFINIYAFFIFIMAAFTGTPWLLFLSNLVCFVPYIFSFAFYQRRLKDLKPMPKGMRVALWMVILSCAGAFGYGFYERSQNLIEPVSRHEHGRGGHGFGYEGGWSSVDLSPYYPWSTPNLLAKLDGPSTLTLTNKIVWDGAEALYPLYAAFAQAVLPESMLKPDDGINKWDYEWKMADKSGVEFHNTIKGFSLLVNQEADIVFNAAPSAAQKEEARRANAELTYTPVALEAFVFFVNKECPIDGLTSQQIRDIYSGKIRNWKELGAPAGRIIAFQRPPNSGSQTTMERFMGETPLAKPLKEEVVRSMGSIIERVAQYRDVANAIGYSFRYYASTMKGSDSIKFLKVDGVAPTPENIASRRYPMTGEVLAITSQHSDPECARLIEWILGPQGQELVRKTGYIPINKQEKNYGKPTE
ncbi:MAG: substrate-binding domain-containing protein [Verrucomicrobia bacterium]|nr:substrate-binding domain-containing protein [Verrucomicrobiota bacterium]